ncbi:MAG TPA: hypothetical protein VGR87_04900 [Candidatus Limnocylindria bacterium]|jgi:hypothetical protein|nr:hypothetical protein [Candidatus Limnocylindria bacterium]
MLLAAGIVGAVVLVLRPITPHIAFNDGYGYDGVAYADLVRAMRGESDGSLLGQRPHFAYRPLPPALVAASGLDIGRGFLALNLLAYVASGPVLVVLLRAYGAPAGAALLATLWWALLPAGLRLAIYYPVMIDGLGLLLMLAVLAAAAWRRVALFGLLLAIGVLARENLIVLVPFLWIRLLPSGLWRATLVTALAATPAALVFEAVRLAPPIPPPARFDVAFEMRQNWDWLLQNAADRAWRFAAAGPTTLGLFSVLPLLRPRRSLDFLRSHPEWIYYLVGTLAVIIVGGGDYDRYFMYFVPALAVLCFTEGWWLGLRAALLTVVQVVISRAWAPTGTSEVEYLAYNVATMPLARLRDLFALAVIGATAAAVIVWWPSRGRRVARPTAATTGP